MEERRKNRITKRWGALVFIIEIRIVPLIQD
jgi:hypothetical protein